MTLPPLVQDILAGAISAVAREAGIPQPVAEAVAREGVTLIVELIKTRRVEIQAPSVVVDRVRVERV